MFGLLAFGDVTENRIELFSALRFDIVSPDFRSGCLWVLQELKKEVEKGESEAAEVSAR